MENSRRQAHARCPHFFSVAQTCNVRLKCKLSRSKFLSDYPKGSKEDSKGTPTQSKLNIFRDIRLIGVSSIINCSNSREHFADFCTKPPALEILLPLSFIFNWSVKASLTNPLFFFFYFFRFSVFFPFRRREMSEKSNLFSVKCFLSRSRLNKSSRGVWMSRSKNLFNLFSRIDRNNFCNKKM